MKIKEVKISKLKFAEYNPRQISKKDFEALKNSIKEFGFVEPVVVNSDYTIIMGQYDLKSNHIKENFIGNIPIENENWNIGVIFGASGTGKTTIVKQLFSDNYIKEFQSMNYI